MPITTPQTQSLHKYFSSQYIKFLHQTFKRKIEKKIWILSKRPKLNKKTAIRNLLTYLLQNKKTFHLLIKKASSKSSLELCILKRTEFLMTSLVSFSWSNQYFLASFLILSSHWINYWVRSNSKFWSFNKRQ